LQQAGQGLDALPPLAHWEIPEGHYFGLGDNTQSSHDGRGWETKTYVLADGREITGFWFDFGKANPHAPSDRNPHYLPGGRLAFADVLGDSFVFGEDEVVDEHVQPSPFIDERFLLGKAVLVFWPILDPFRWKTIR
jgi:hypothetical protein